MNILNIGNKLALIMIALSIAVITILTALFLKQFENALNERVLLQLSSVKQLKILKIKAELNDRMEAFRKLVETNDTTGYSDAFDQFQIRSSIPDSIDLKLDENSEQIQLVDCSMYGQTIKVCFIGFKDNQYYIASARIPEIQEILLERTGLGQTGESYIVGQDSVLRTRSRFVNPADEQVKVNSQGVKNALEGFPGESIIEDYRGKTVFSAYEKIEVAGLVWVILTEIDAQEALFPLSQLKKNLIYILVIILIFILMTSYFLSQMIVSPVLMMERKLNTMSKGILTNVRTDFKRKDEIGRMFSALNKLVSALRETIRFANKIGEGDFNAQYQPLGPEDRLGEALIQMKEKLSNYQANEQRLLKENQRSILNGEEKERSRLAREIHDGLGPLLTTLRINIQSAEIAAQKKSDLQKQLDTIISEVRRISNNLMPSVLIDFGAGEAIGNLIKQLSKGFDGSIRYKNDMSSDLEIESSIHITLYRIAQESLNNAIKHAYASEIKVSITSFEDHIGYYIADNGQGFNPLDHPSGNGLRNMKERVKVSSGSIEITSNASGTTLEVEIPIK